MNGVDWTSIAVQIPVVGAFIWFSNHMLKAFLTALDARDARYETRNNALIEALTANTAQLAQLTSVTGSHDAWTREAVDLMVKTADARVEKIQALSNIAKNVVEGKGK